MFNIYRCCKISFNGDFPQLYAVPSIAIASVNSTRPSFSTLGKRDRRNYRFMATTRFLTDHHIAFICSFLVERDGKERKRELPTMDATFVSRRETGCWIFRGDKRVRSLLSSLHLSRVLSFRTLVIICWAFPVRGR